MRGRHVCRPYGVKMKGMQWKACGPGMSGPYGVAAGEVGGIGKVRGRHVCRPYGRAVWWVATARVTAGENICLRIVRKSFILIL